MLEANKCSFAFRCLRAITCTLTLGTLRSEMSRVSSNLYGYVFLGDSVELHDGGIGDIDEAMMLNKPRLNKGWRFMVS